MKKKDPLLRQTLVTDRTPSGLPVCVVPMPGFSEKCAALLVRYGAIDLTFTHPSRGRQTTTPGIAHFLEHELFKKEGKDALLEFGRFGASANAYTDYAATVYHFKGSADFDKCLDLLLDFTLSAYFTEEYVERERFIIEQELKMYEDMPDFIAYRNLMRGMYTAHPLRIDIGGEVSDLAKITQPVLTDIYETFYQPVNMVLVASGDVDPDAVLRQASEKVHRNGGGGVRRELPSPDDGIAVRKHEEKRMASRPRVLIGVKDAGRVNRGPAIRRDRMRMGVALDLVFGRTSEFHRKHYASGLIDDTFSFAYRRELDFGFTVLGGETDDPDKLVEAVQAQIRALGRFRLKSRDVNRAKKRRLGRYIGAFDHPESAAFYVLDCLQHGFDVFGMPKELARVQRGEIETRMREHLREENVAVSIVNPAAG